MEDLTPAERDADYRRAESESLHKGADEVSASPFRVRDGREAPGLSRAAASDLALVMRALADAYESGARTGEWAAHKGGIVARIPGRGKLGVKMLRVVLPPADPVTDLGRRRRRSITPPKPKPRRHVVWLDREGVEYTTWKALA
jgi:hypothetical protein